jgi:hypothetical protein
MLEIMRWNDDDAIAHDHLRMRITSQTQPNLTLSIVSLSQGVLVCLTFITRQWLHGS